MDPNNGPGLCQIRGSMACGAASAEVLRGFHGDFRVTFWCGNMDISEVIEIDFFYGDVIWDGEVRWDGEVYDILIYQKTMLFGNMIINRGIWGYHRKNHEKPSWNPWNRRDSGFAQISKDLRGCLRSRDDVLRRLWVRVGLLNAVWCLMLEMLPGHAQAVVRALEGP